MDKKILIAGKGSYIGSNIKAWINEKESNWSVDDVDTKNDEWKSIDFSEYDTVIHVAGLAHQRITDENRALYYSINCDMAVDIAKIAKVAGVKQFVFLSSMSVYSDETTYVNFDTKENPDNDYGKGKLLAEEKLKELSDKDFMLSIVRPPMVYGKGCKGNYNSLRKIALLTPVFSLVDNKRSMIYIDNLAEFIYRIIEHEIGGTLYPQNRELVNTSRWAYEIASVNGKTMYLSKFLGICVKLGRRVPKISNYIKKAFDDGYYDLSMSTGYLFDYQIVSFEESIKQTEK